MTVALVTDSTAYLPEELIARHGIVVVPLHVSADDVQYTEGVDLDEADLLRLLKRSRRLTTSRPSPRAFYDVYERLASQGVREIVSVHLSAELSGTYDAATLAARQASVPVHVVDSGSMGMTLGHAVLTAVDRAEQGATGEEVAQAATARARAGGLLFYVHTLEFLRRGGRIGNAAAFLGSALAVRPLLSLDQGRIEPVEKVRTTARALARLVDLAGDFASERNEPVAVTVHHLQDEERAQRLAAALEERLGAAVADEVAVRPIGAVAAVHLGPGAMAVSLSPTA
ncbi:MAG: DegV family protein [Mobilicoccus sp.]|nr:DegV family protein [Mobilicoccus sp.]